jgi:predicted kinase
MSVPLFKKELTFMVGISGSGKSTKARNEVNALNKKAGLTVDPNFSEDAITGTIPAGSTDSTDGAGAGSGQESVPTTRAFVCSADNFPDLYTDGRINFGLLGDAHSWCYQSVRMCMEGGHQVYLDNTNLRPDHWVDYLNLAKEFGYTVRMLTPTNKLLFYEVRGKDRQDQQLSHVVAVRSTGSKVIPADKIREMESLFMNTMSTILPAKSRCGSDPDKWLQVAESWVPPRTIRR